MDYEKKYKDALERAKSFKTPELRDVAEYIFPELKESKGERIRKAMIDYFKWNPDGQLLNEFSNREVFAWLEKQGEKKPVVIIPKFRIGDNIKTTNEEPLTITKIDDKGYWSEDLFICDFDDAAKWELVEQKPANKIEPIFNVGDKIQYSKGCGTIMTIKKIENGEYIFANNMGHTTIESGNKWYLVEQNLVWSEEASAFKDKLLELFQKFRWKGTPTNGDIIEYVDAHIQELIDTIQKPDWSEEDNKWIESLIQTFEDGYFEGFNQLKSYGVIDWLNSLKNKYENKSNI